MHKRFREHAGFFKKHGVEVIGFGTPHSEQDGKGKTVIYMIAFPSMEAAKASWKSFGGDAERKKIWAEINKVGDIVDHWEAVYLDPTDDSPMQ